MLEIHLELINPPTLTPSVCKKLLRPMKLSCIQIFGLFFFYLVHVFFSLPDMGTKACLILLNSIMNSLRLSMLSWGLLLLSQRTNESKTLWT